MQHHEPAVQFVPVLLSPSTRTRIGTIRRHVRLSVFVIILGEGSCVQCSESALIFQLSVHFDISNNVNTGGMEALITTLSLAIPN